MEITPPVCLTFEEYQDVRQALSYAQGVLEAVSEVKPRKINLAPVAQTHDAIATALGHLRRARERREDARD